ncbi:unnamed protein product [Urochloa humidicola]
MAADGGCLVPSRNSPRYSVVASLAEESGATVLWRGFPRLGSKHAIGRGGGRCGNRGGGRGGFGNRQSASTAGAGKKTTFGDDE